MKTPHRTLIIAALVHLAAGLAGIVAEGQPIVATVPGFDWNRWAAVVHEDPCGWLDGAALTRVFGTEVPQAVERSRGQVSCVWRTPDNTTLLRASVIIWDTAANLARKRREQIGQVEEGVHQVFQQVEAPGGVVTAMLRRDHSRLSLLPNSDDERASIAISSPVLPREDAPSRAAGRDRVMAFGRALIDRYGL